MVYPPSGVRHEDLFHDLHVGVRQDGGAALVADLLVGPLDHAMALVRLVAAHLAGAGHGEALFGAALGLELGHFLLPCKRIEASRRTRHALELSRPARWKPRVIAGDV